MSQTQEQGSDAAPWDRSEVLHRRKTVPRRLWARDEATPGSTEGDRCEDGRHLHDDGRSSPRGWVISDDTGLLPPPEARNHELGVDEAEEAREWADGLIGFGRGWAGRVADFGTESVVLTPTFYRNLLDICDFFGMLLT
jgi:hypothetical protein